MSLEGSEFGQELISKILFSSNVHRSSVCRAKQKIPLELYRSLLSKTALGLRASALWKGHTVRAIDGTSLTLPNTTEIRTKFPIHRKNEFYPRAVLVTAVNVFTQSPEFAEVGDFRTSENAVVNKMIESFAPGDIALLDRGIGGKSLWLRFMNRAQFFVSRLKGGYGESVYQKFAASKKLEAVIYLKFADGVERPVRLIRASPRSSLKPIILITNLLSPRKYHRLELARLYKERWQVETCYFRMKQRMQIMKWHSKKLEGILIEILSSLLAIAILGKQIFLARLRLQNSRRKNTIQNFNAAIFIMRNALVEDCSLQKLRKRLLMCGCPKQPDRSYPRYSKQPQNRWIIQRRPSSKSGP